MTDESQRAARIMLPVLRADHDERAASLRAAAFFSLSFLCPRCLVPSDYTLSIFKSPALSSPSGLSHFFLFSEI